MPWEDMITENRRMVASSFQDLCPHEHRRCSRDNTDTAAMWSSTLSYLQSLPTDKSICTDAFVDWWLPKPGLHLFLGGCPHCGSVWNPTSFGCVLSRSCRMGFTLLTHNLVEMLNLSLTRSHRVSIPQDMAKWIGQKGFSVLSLQWAASDHGVCSSAITSLASFHSHVSDWQAHDYTHTSLRLMDFRGKGKHPVCTGPRGKSLACCGLYGVAWSLRQGVSKFRKGGSDGEARTLLSPLGCWKISSAV